MFVITNRLFIIRIVYVHYCRNVKSYLNPQIYNVLVTNYGFFNSGGFIQRLDVVDDVVLGIYGILGVIKYGGWQFN